MYLGLIFLSMASKILTYPEGIYTQENIFRTKLYQTTGERLAKIRLLQTKHKLKVPLNKMQRVMSPLTMHPDSCSHVTAVLVHRL
jgi:hypothetical protein